MQIKHYTYFLGYFVFLFFIPISNQAQTELLKKALTTAGFENIRAIEKDNELILSLENNVYRYSPTGVTVVMDSINNYFIGKPVNLIILDKGVPAILIRYSTIMIDSTYVLKDMDVTYETERYWSLVKDCLATNTHKYKTDIVIYPQVAFQNHNLKGIYEGQFNIAPAVSTSLWKGMLITGQLIIPVYNNLNVEGDYIRPGFVVLSQKYRFKNSWFGELSGGLFNAYRYGFDLKIQRPIGNQNWDISFQTGYTGDSQIENGDWKRSSLNTFTCFTSLSYYYSQYDIKTSIGAGRFINEDYGINFNVSRYFGETSISFYAFVGDGPFTGGFHFSVPIAPRKRNRNNNVRVVPAKYFDLKYNYESEPLYFKTYETKPGGNPFGEWTYPLWMKKEILKKYQL